MTAWSSLTPAAATVDGAEEVAIKAPAGFRRRTWNSLVSFILGPDAAALRGFYGATPVARPTSANQAAVTATVGTAVATTSATNSSPYGFTTSAQADALVARVNELKTLTEANKVLLNQMRADLVALGLIKGSA